MDLRPPPLWDLLTSLFPFPWIAVNFIVLLIAVCTAITGRDPPRPLEPVFAMSLVETETETEIEIQADERDVEVDSAIVMKEPNQVESKCSSSMETGTLEPETESGYQSDDEGGSYPCRSMDSTWRGITGAGKRKHFRKKNKRNPKEDSELALNSYKSVLKRKDSSSSQQEDDLAGDELKYKIDEFIDKFKKELVLQRQESDQRFLEMISKAM